jgi:glycosyltransferase involved in cell wall biosynthesis
MSRSRICLLTNQYPPAVGGVGNSAQRIARLLAETDLEVHVLHLAKSSEPLHLGEAIDTVREERLWVHRARVWHPDWRGTDGEPARGEAEVLTRYNREMFEVATALQRRFEFELLHGFFLYPAGYIATLVARTHGVPSIVSIRGNDVGKYMFDPLRAGFVATSLRNADRVTSVARSLAVAADAALSPIEDKSRVILNSIDPELAQEFERPQLPLRGVVIGSAGLFRYKKGLIYLFEALAALRDREFTLLLIGDYFGDDDREVHQAQIERFGLADRVVLTGRLSRSELLAHLPLLDIAVFPSLFAEGCPNSLLESMLKGRAIVASRTGAIPELLTDGEDGLLVDPGASEPIERALRRLIDAPDLRRRLGHGASRRVRELHPSREREAWLALYHELLANPAPAGRARRTRGASRSHGDFAFPR